MSQIANIVRRSPYNTLMSGLVSAWEMNEVDELVDSMSGYDGVVTGTLTEPEEGTVRFAGSEIVNVPNQAELNPTDALTVEVWLKVVTDTTVAQTVISKLRADGTHVSPFFGYSLHLLRINATTFQPRFWVSTSDRASGDSRLGTNFAINTWVHIVGKYKSGLLAIHQNNSKLIDATPPSGTLNQYTSSLRFGAVGNGTELFNGELKAARIWNRCLEDEEVTTLHNDGEVLPFPFS